MSEVHFDFGFLGKEDEPGKLVPGVGDKGTCYWHDDGFYDAFKIFRDVSYKSGHRFPQGDRL